MAKISFKNGIVQDKSINGVPIEVKIIAKVTGEWRPGLAMNPKYSVYHETGNPNTGANADMHNRWLQNIERSGADGSSFHFVVDDKKIIQNIPINEVAWCQGDGYSGTGNRYGISVEQCINSGGDIEKAIDNACRLHAGLIETLGVKLTKHQDWTGKKCPSRILSAGRWPEIVKKIEGYVGKEGTELKEEVLKSVSEADRVKFIEDLAPLIRSYAKRIYPSVSIAQACLESNFGTSVLATRANNIFGIKAKDDWGGSKFEKVTWEMVDGNKVKILAPFRSYKSKEESIIDHENFFITPAWREKHYANVLNAGSAIDQAKALTGTYATDSQYSAKLIDIMKKYGLEKYDRKSEENKVSDVYVIAYWNDGDLANALALLNVLGNKAVLTRTLDATEYKWSEVIQIGGTEIKGATRIIKGATRKETLLEVARYLEGK